jgi:DNA-directed RNA polymerase subunit RPC12/RpoP
MDSDICSACGYEFLLSDMVNLTRVGYDPCMVYECINCAELITDSDCSSIDDEGIRV